MSSRRAYVTDLLDEEWRILEPLVPEAKPGSRSRAYKARNSWTRFSTLSDQPGQRVCTGGIETDKHHCSVRIV